MGAVCPSHYNPADFFIQLLAVVPNAEESCRSMIEMVCDSFATSEIGSKIATIAEVKNGAQVKYLKLFFFIYSFAVNKVVSERIS